MEELTIKENAKAYDELINRLEDVKDAIKKQNYGIAMDVLCKPYPEFQITTQSALQKSEDEKIRKELLNAFQESEDSLYMVLTPHKRESFIAWLEKQCVHANFINKIQIGDKVTRNQDGVLVSLSQLERVAKPVEEYNITGIGSKHAQGKLGEMIKNLKSAWSEEDEKTIDEAVEKLERYAEYVQGGYSKQHILDLASSVESLKDRYTWKPSDEQIEALVSAIDVMIDNRGAGDKKTVLLSGLYHELKAL